MLARVSALLLVAGICWAETTQPRPRPRLEPVVLSELPKPPAPSFEVGSASPFRSFDDFLAAGARRPVGLEAYREPRAARGEEGGPENNGRAAKDEAGTSSGTVTAGGSILVLPKLEVNADKLTKLKEKLAALEANQSWQAHSAEAWKTRSEGGLALDAILNPPFLRLGSYSGNGRIALAQQRVELLRWVRILAISLEQAKTPAERARIQADIDAITGITRMWE